MYYYSGAFYSLEFSCLSFVNLQREWLSCIQQHKYLLSAFMYQTCTKPWKCQDKENTIYSLKEYSSWLGMTDMFTITIMQHRRRCIQWDEKPPWNPRRRNVSPCSLCIPLHLYLTTTKCNPLGVMNWNVTDSFQDSRLAG